MVSTAIRPPAGRRRWALRVASVLGLLALGAGAAAFARTKPVFRVQADERVELVSILWRLAGAAEYNQSPVTPYTRAVDAHFATYRDHPAVKVARRLLGDRGLGYNAPVSLAVHLDAVPGLRPRVAWSPFPARLDPRWPDHAIGEFLYAARMFVQHSGFQQFMKKQRPYLRAVEQAYRQALGRDHPLGWCQDFFGPKRSIEATLVPGLLTGPHGYGASAVLSGGREVVVAVLGLGQVGPDGLPQLEDRAALAGFLQHELAHAYVNPAVEQQAGALEDVGRRLYERVADRMKAQAYTDWRIMLSETIVRASTVLFLKDRFGEPVAAAALFRDRARGFGWMAEVVAQFERYRGVNRSKRSFPTQVRALAALLERWLETPEDQRSEPFVGPINAVFDGRHRRADRMVLVAPAVLSSDPGGQAALGYVGQVHRKFFAQHQVPLRSIDQVTQAEQAQAMVLYGTPASNPLLAGMLKGFGWQVDPQGIALGQRRFDGPQLALIACHPHPKDLSRPVLVYASARSQDLVGINNLFHGGTDWVIARRVGDGTFQEVAKGDFPKTLSGSVLRLGE